MVRCNRSLNATLLSCSIASLLAHAATAQDCNIEVLENFDALSGISPAAGVIQGTDGALYGTTWFGGANGWGTIFKMNTDGTGYTVLEDLDQTTGNQAGALLQASDGALYGTAVYGGTYNGGTIFKLNTDGTGFTVLVNLGLATTGEYPYAGLIQGSDGALYGTASAGGAHNYGTVFKLNTDGSGFTDLLDFDYTNTGANPFGSLMQLSYDGMLYGTAWAGGSQYDGTVFKLNTDGTGFAVIVNFSSQTGNAPVAGLIPFGVFVIGVTSRGPQGGGGELFGVAFDGSGYTDVFDFDGSAAGTTGYSPRSVLLERNGALYGVTSQGGSSGDGTLFEYSFDSGFRVVAAFDGANSGAAPLGGLIQGADGNFYGTTSSGGPNTWTGNVFSFTPIYANWNNYGSGTLGTSGHVPNFVSSAAPVIGTTITMAVDNSRGSITNGILIVGLSEASINLKNWGGTLLVGNIIAVFPIALPAAGFSFDGQIPDDPCSDGFEADLQVLEFDPGAVDSVSFTPGLHLLFGLD